MNFQEKLKLYLKSTGLSQKELGEKLGYSDTMMSRYLNSNKPNYEFLNALIEAFPKINLNYLFKDEIINELAEESAVYTKNELGLVEEIDQRLRLLKEKLTQERHD